MAKPVPNRSNIEDDKYQWIFIGFMTLSVLYVVFRCAVLYILNTHRTKRFGGDQNMALWKKIVCISFPAILPITLVIRTINQTLNNQCEFFVPFSFLERYTVQNVLLIFQLRALVVLAGVKDFKQFVQQREKRELFNRWSFIIAMIPAVVLTILFYAYRAGVPLHGVCTLGSTNGKGYWLNVHYWVWISQAYEFLFIICSVVVEWRLHSSVYIPDDKKEELQMCTRMALFFLVWDTLFRFQVMIRFLHACFDKHGDEYNLAVKVYSMIFVTVYVGGTAIMFAHCYELHWSRYCRLLHPFQGRFWRLLAGNEFLELHEAGFKFKRDGAESNTSRMTESLLAETSTTVTDHRRETTMDYPTLSDSDVHADKSEALYLSAGSRDGNSSQTSQASGDSRL